MPFHFSIVQLCNEEEITDTLLSRECRREDIEVDKVAVMVDIMFWISVVIFFSIWVIFLNFTVKFYYYP